MFTNDGIVDRRAMFRFAQVISIDSLHPNIAAASVVDGHATLPARKGPRSRSLGGCFDPRVCCHRNIC